MQAQKKNLEVDSETALSEEEGEKAAEVADDGAPHCLSGSLSSQYGGNTFILYHQCDLHTKEQKLNQIILLKVISSENLSYCSDTLVSAAFYSSHSHCQILTY